MNGRVGAVLCFSLLAGAVVTGTGGCEHVNEPPPETAKSSPPRPPDRTEVTMEVSDAAPPGEPVVPSAAPATSDASPDPSEEPTIGGVQPDAAVEKAVAPVRPRLRVCYKKALAAEPNAGGSATFDATIAKDGRVASARFVKRDGLDEDMVGCLLVAVKSMTFEPTKRSQIVTLSFGSAASSGSAPPAGPADASAPQP